MNVWFPASPTVYSGGIKPGHRLFGGSPWFAGTVGYLKTDLDFYNLALILSRVLVTVDGVRIDHVQS
jgi:hypothetical protein